MERKRLALFIDYIDSDYSQRLIKGAKAYLDSKDVDFLVFPCGSINYQKRNYGYQRLAVASLINRNSIDGMIFACGVQEAESTSEQIHSYMKSFRDIPVVCIGHDYDDYPCIVQSDNDCMGQIAEHLIKVHRRKNPAIFIPKTPSMDILSRIQNFNAALRQLGISISNENIITCSSITYSSAMEGIQEYKEKYGKFKFDSLICMTDLLAFASMDYLNSCGIKIPDDIMVTGFDDEKDAASYSPTLTTVNQNVEDQSYNAAKMLFKMIFRNRKFTDTVTIQSSPCFRQSCGCIKKNADKILYKDFKGKEHLTKAEGSDLFGISQWNYNKSSLLRIIQMHENFASGILMDTLAEKIEDELTSLKISKCTIVLFDSPISTDRFEYFPLPSKAHVLASFDAEGGLHYCIKDRGSQFNPKEMIVPDGHVSSLNGMNVLSLFTNSILYGYILFKPGNLDPVVYRTSVEMLASTIARASKSYEELKMKRQLEIENSKMRIISVTDEMTGLLNRRGFMTHGKEAIASSIEQGRKGLVIFGDMDGLKFINDTYGHAAGDEAIKAEAEILKSLFISTDIIGRLGGDEFAIVAPEMDRQKFSVLKNTLHEKCRKYNETSGEKFVLSISIGCTEYGPNKETEIKNLLEAADDEQYKEKNMKHESNALNAASAPQ